MDCFQAAFCADDTLIEFIPNFNFDGSMPLQSSTKPCGPFQAGLPSLIPVWLAVHLHRQSLGKIIVPEWLSVTNLRDIIRQERESDGYFHDIQRLPHAYYEIGRRLKTIAPDAVILLLEDLLELRIDKLRRQFQDIVSEPQRDLMIEVNGIGSHELALLRPFVQQALSDRYQLKPAGKGDEVDVDDDNNAAASVRSRLPVRRFRVV